MRTRAPGSDGPDSFPEDTERRTLGWIGVDLDGTLAKSVKSQAAEDIGVPIYRMVKQVKKWLAQGQDVRIFTARVNPYHRRIEAFRARRAIEAWSKRHLGQVLRITHEKDWDMVLLFDDRARQVERDRGRVVGSYPRKPRLQFSHRILVYLYVGVHPDMESRPTQMRAQNGRFGLTHPRRGKKPNGGSTRVRARSPFCFGTGPAVFCWRLRITGMGPLQRRRMSIRHVRSSHTKCL